MISDDRLSKYSDASKICKLVYNHLVDLIKTGKCVNVKTLSTLGTTMINDECKKVYKRVIDKGPTGPVSIALNNCVSNYCGEEDDIIKPGDVIKIDLGVNIDGCNVIHGDTFVLENEVQGNNRSNVILCNLDKIKTQVLDLLISGEINDEVRILIESMCTEIGCFPIENCISYQHLDNYFKTDESKYIILNYIKRYNQNDELLVRENICFEFLEDEVYTLDISVVDTEGDDTYFIEKHNPHIYRFNEFYNELSSKYSREFYNDVKSKHGNSGFDIRKYNTSYKNRIGISEALNKGILENYPVLYEKGGRKVYSKKFTVVIGKDSKGARSFT